VVKSYASNGWTYNQDERYDYGALRLNCTIGYYTNWLDYGAPAGDIVGYPTRLCGYPSDKTIDTQWCSDDEIWATDAYQAYYENDTVPRMSGGPVLGWTGSAWYVMAIHTMPIHGTAWNHSSFNHGTLITSAVSNDLHNWDLFG
jgi:glutamyl endopeptidase